jgi:hypothetical protein
MRPSRRTVGIVAGLVASLAGVSLGAQDTTLRYRWTKGEVVRYRTTTQTDMTMSGIPGMGDMNVTTSMVQVTKMVTDSVAADGTATVKVTYESVKMSMSIPMMGDVVFDSANPAAAAGNPIAEGLKPLGALVGQEFTITSSPLGKILKIDGLGPIFDKVKAQLEASGAGAGGLGGANNLSSILSEDAQRSTMQQASAPFPEKPIKAGESWDNSFKIPNPFGQQLVAYKYTLKDVTGDTARIMTAATVKPDGPATPMGPMTVTMGDGTGQGEITFDVKSGRARKTVSTLSMPLAMAMAAPDGTNINLQATTKTTTTVELIEK